MKMRLFAILAIAVLMLGVVLAETGSDKDSVNDATVMDDNTDDSAHDSTVNSEVEVEEEHGATEIKVRERVKAEDRINSNSGHDTANDARKLNERLLKAREIAKDKLQKAFERYQEARQHYEEAKGRYEERKGEFDELKVKIKDRCTNNTNQTNSTECGRIRDQLTDKAKQQVIEAGNRIIAHLEKIKERVDGSEQIDNDTAAAIIADIDDKIEEVNAIIADAEAATTKTEIQDAAKKLREIWQSLLNHGRVYAGYVLVGTYDKTLARLDTLGTRVQNAIGGLEGDHPDLDALYANYTDAVSSAGDKVDKAKELLRQANNIKDTDAKNAATLVRQAQDELKSAKGDINNAFKVLRQIVQALKAQDVQIDTSTDASAEVVA